MVSPAPKYLWIITFPKNDQNSLVDAELCIPNVPSLQQKSESAPFNVEIDVLGFLGFIQNLCEEIRKESIKREQSVEQNSEESTKNTEKLNQNLKNLEDIMSRFNEIMKRLNKPPPPNIQ